MVVTDHAEDFPPEKINQFITHCQKISDDKFLVIPGLEFNIDKDKEVHLLLVGLNGLPYEKGSEAVLEKVLRGENNALAVVAHLSRSNHYIPKEYENRINGIEIWNAAYDSRYLPDHKAIRLYADLKKVNKQLIGFGGLDLHDLSGFRELRICLTTPCHSSKELLDHLKSGKFIIRGPFVSISSMPRFGLYKIFLLSLCRKVLTVADFIRWKSAECKKALLKRFSTRKLAIKEETQPE